MQDENRQDVKVPSTDENKIEAEAEQVPEETEPAPVVYKNAKERIYDKIPLTVNQLNVIIAVVIVAIVVVLVIGTMAGNGLIG